VLLKAAAAIPVAQKTGTARSLHVHTLHNSSAKRKNITAYELYTKVINKNPVSEMAFNARINRARCVDAQKQE
jgi:hypothetical protein